MPRDRRTHPHAHPLSITVRVRYVECDMQGHVFNGHYLTWFDMAHTALLTAAAGRAYSELVASGTDVVVAEAGVRYHAPARYDDELEVGIGVEEPTTSSLTSRLAVVRGDELIATGFLRHVCVDARAMTKLPWPDDLRAGLGRFLLAPADAPSAG